MYVFRFGFFVWCRVFSFGCIIIGYGRGGVKRWVFMCYF